MKTAPAINCENSYCFTSKRGLSCIIASFVFFHNGLFELVLDYYKSLCLSSNICAMIDWSTQPKGRILQCGLLNSVSLSCLIQRPTKTNLRYSPKKIRLVRGNVSSYEHRTTVSYINARGVRGNTKICWVFFNGVDVSSVWTFARANRKYCVQTRLRALNQTDIRLQSDCFLNSSLYKKAVLKGKPKEVKYVVAKKSQGTFFRFYKGAYETRTAKAKRTSF